MLSKEMNFSSRRLGHKDATTTIIYIHKIIALTGAFTLKRMPL